MNQKSSVLQPGKSAYMASPPVTGKRIRSGDALLSFTPARTAALRQINPMLPGERGCAKPAHPDELLNGVDDSRRRGPGSHR